MAINKVEMSQVEANATASAFLAGVGTEIGNNFVLVGSLRRRRAIVHDVDILIRSVDSDLMSKFFLDCQTALFVTIHKWGAKLASLTYCYVPFDLYFSTPETFATLLLIRTGSKENNIRLCSIAKSKGWKLHASGDGLFNEQGERIAGDSERSIYDALGVQWQEPWERG